MYGEKWLFEFNYLNNTASITGSEVGYDNWPVIEGIPPHLDLDDDEQKWLNSSWAEATKNTSISLYMSLETEFLIQDKYCGLTNNYCPICLKKRAEFEIHHCIPSNHGGTNDSHNMLRLCNTCHALITNGCFEDREPRFKAAMNHQMMYFGVSFFPEEDSKNKTKQQRDINYYKDKPLLLKALKEWDNSTPEVKNKIDTELKRVARIDYQYYRDIGRGIWSWKEHCERFHVRQ